MSSTKTIITIDGPAAAGKGTVAKELARLLGCSYLDTGAMYRALALRAKQEQKDIHQPGVMDDILAHTRISFIASGEGPQRVLLNGSDVTEEVRGAAIANLASDIATLPSVREWMTHRQREIALELGKLVAEGRDMGTTVFPEAEYKFFLDAKPEVRAIRRWLELKEWGSDVTLEDIKSQIIERDTQDTERELAPLHPAHNAVIIDTTNIAVGEVVETILEAVKGE